MALFRSILFALAFYPVTVMAVGLSLVAALVGREPLIRLALLWTRYHRWCARHLLGIRTRVEGTIPTGPVLIASKHQSMYETLELVRLLGRPAVVIKQELADIPAWGWVARRYGVIPVVRTGGAPALRKMLRAAKAAVVEGRALLIFPEGTRVPPGATPSLQPGFTGLYKAVELPVVPVALDSGRLWPCKSFVKYAGIVTLRFGDPIPAGLDRKEIEARVHAAINVLETEVVGLTGSS